MINAKVIKNNVFCKKKNTLFYTQAELKRQVRAFFAKNRFANARLVPLHGIRIAGAFVVFQGIGQG